MKEIHVTKYVANDGHEFNSKERCEKHDNQYDRIKFYTVYYHPVLEHKHCLRFVEIGYVAILYTQYPEMTEAIMNEFLRERFCSPTTLLASLDEDGCRTKDMEIVDKYRYKECSREDFLRNKFDYDLQSTTDLYGVHSKIYLTDYGDDFDTLPSPDYIGDMVMHLSMAREKMKRTAFDKF